MSRSGGLIALALICVFLTSRVALFVVNAPDYLSRLPQQDDAPAYQELADIWQGEATYEQYQRSPLTRVPLYPLFLAAMPEYRSTIHLPTLFILQQVMELVVLGLVFWTIRQQHPAWVALLVTVSLTLFFDFTLYGFLVRSEALFTLLVLISSLLFVRLCHSGQFFVAAVTGCFFGLATLTRPVALLIIVPLLGILWYWPRHATRPLKKTIALSALLVGSFSLVLLPWFWRNYNLTGDFVLQQDIGNILYATYPGGHWQSVNIHELIDTTNKSEVVVDQELTELARQRIKEHPQIWITNSLKNFLFRLWAMGFADTHLRYLGYLPAAGGYHQDESGLLARLTASWNLFHPDITAPLWLHLYFLGNNIIGFVVSALSLSLLFLWPSLSSSRKILAVILVYFWAITAIFAFSGSRYMVPLLPILAILSPNLGRAMANFWPGSILPRQPKSHQQ